ncbi:hypothetical protein GBA52_019938 [Prunus armeniaca]|nr:hypothetical protein GBA52_019938 [Prunus armeniaca]
MKGLAWVYLAIPIVEKIREILSRKWNLNREQRVHNFTTEEKNNGKKMGPVKDGEEDGRQVDEPDLLPCYGAYPNSRFGGSALMGSLNSHTCKPFWHPLFLSPKCHMGNDRGRLTPRHILPSQLHTHMC